MDRLFASFSLFFFFFNDTATTEIYTLSLHDALPICVIAVPVPPLESLRVQHLERLLGIVGDADAACVISTADRKSTRLNSSHANISYAVFCLKKKKTSSVYRETSKKSHTP